MPDYPRVIAHRCGGALAPENTRAGLQVAARLGIKGVEFDVMLTRDGAAVLIHDETLERTTNGHGRVAEHDLADLLQLDAGVSGNAAHSPGGVASAGHLRPDGLPVSREPTFAGERIPTFEQAWQDCASLGLWANVEIKPSEGCDAVTGAVVGDYLHGRWRVGAGIVSSFSEVALRAFAERAPDVPRALLVTDIPADWQERLARAGCVALHCKGDQGVPPRLGEVLAAGVPVACYTINQSKIARSLWLAGVAAIFTDRTDICNAWQ